MTAEHASAEHLRLLFTESFTVRDVAESLVSFDAAAPADEVGALMAERGFDAVGVRRNGRVAGCVARGDLGDGPCGRWMRPFSPAEVVDDTLGLPGAVRLFHAQMHEEDRPCGGPRLFVNVFGHVGGIVTLGDMQKPPVRMWLFGMVTMIEMGLTRLIARAFPGDGWRDQVSPARLAKAEELLAERKRRNQDLGLLDCLQFADKGQIVLRQEPLRREAGFRSRSKGEETVKELESLRNNLAHSQEIIPGDWPVIVKLTEYLDTVLAAPSAENQT